MDVRFLWSFRLLMSLKAFFTVLIMYLQRNGFNSAVVCINCNTNGTPTGASRDCFNMSKQTVGLTTGSFFWGYALTQALAGYLTRKMGLKLSICFATLLSSITTFLIPLATAISYKLVVFLRMCTGIAQGFLWPFIQSLVSSWSPESERSVHLSIITCGLGVGPALAAFLTGPFCQISMPYSRFIFFRNGWAIYFYFSGLLGMLDLLLTAIFLTSTPKDNRFISSKEKLYIADNMVGREAEEDQELRAVPWRALLLSSIFWAFLIALVFSDVGIYAIWTMVPQFMHEVLRFDIAENGLYASLPYILHVVSIVASGFLSKWIVTHKKLSRTNSCKMFQAVGCIGAAMCLIVITFLTEYQRMIAVSMLVIGFTFHGLIIGGGIVLNCNDFAGSFAGIAFSIANTASAIMGFLVPYLTSILTKDGVESQWDKAFFIYAAAYVLSCLVFTVVGSSELQPWTQPAQSIRNKTGPIIFDDDVIDDDFYDDDDGSNDDDWQMDNRPELSHTDSIW